MKRNYYWFDLLLRRLGFEKELSRDSKILRSLRKYFPVQGPSRLTLDKQALEQRFAQGISTLIDREIESSLKHFKKNIYRRIQ